jgi:hypothetical protein
MRALVAFAVSLLATGCDSATHQASFNFGVGGKPRICIPAAEIDAFNRSLTHSSVWLRPQSTPTTIATVHYDGKELTKAIPGFQLIRGYRNDSPPNALSAIIDFVGPHYPVMLGSAAGPDASNIWNRTSPCNQPVIARVPNSLTYLAKCDRDNFWHILFDRYPGRSDKAGSDIHGSVLAECTHLNVTFGPHEGTQMENCTRRLRIGDFRIDYQFELNNAGLIANIDEFMQNRFDKWRANCRVL